jgi:hypothetical protein
MTGHLSKPDDWKKIPKKMLNIGIKIEMEHTSNSKTARRIMSDHYAEFGEKYYPALIKMEEKLEKENKKRKARYGKI